MKINSFIFSLFIALVSFSALSAPPPRPPKPLPPPTSAKYYAKVTGFEDSAQEPLARQCANIGVGSYIGYSPGFKVIPLRKVLPNGISCIAIEIGPSASVVYTRNSVQYRIWFSWEFKEECPENQKFNPLSGLCEVPCDYGMNDDGTCKNKCDFGLEVGHTKILYWHPMATGNDVQYGCYYTGGINAEYCTMKQSGETKVTCTGVIDGHITANTRCSTEFSYTGSKCSEGDKPFWGDGEAKPDPDIDPDTDTNDPEHKPDDPTGDIVDPSVLPDSDSDVVVPDKPDGKPDVEDPDIEPGTDKAVVNAVVGLNKDVNKALNDLHIDINRNKADIQNEIRTLNASVVTNTQAVQKQQINDNKIYKNTKALIQQANGDITTAVNKNTNGTVKGLKELDASVGELNANLDDVKGLLKGGDFGSPNGEDVAELIFTSSDFMSINRTIEDKRSSIQRYADEVKGMVSISTNFNSGSLSDRSFTVKGATVESGLQRFDRVSGYVRPVVLFICVLIALWVLFGNKGK
ncbi:hypothetical protein PQE20_21490 [Vibrio harveyi]|uniref:hypothetical protein n=1 Tax=Vibrio harveyi TaxID=669 RepID=UPI00234D2411|nr:hypothetical protein [Vibrio harveyi]WCP83982.1 hypothetical protein PQE20_21445 [Vibrio harveyi]WCP83991.1 hypothetical protein PQE20_21490 [Vibrio harveyi]